MVLENAGYPEDTRVRKEALALLEAGHRVTVLAPRLPGQPARDVVDGVAVRRYRVPVAAGSAGSYLREYLVAHAQLLPRVLGELLRGAHVVHVHNPPDTLVVLGLAARVFGRKVVYDHHDLFPELFELKFGPNRVVGVLRGFQRLSFRLADAVIVTNESQRSVAHESGADPARVALVRNGPSRATIVQGGCLRDGDLGDPQLLFLGALESQDGVDALPDLLERLRSLPSRSSARLTIVGDGAARPALVQAFADRGLEPYVRFTGHVPGADVPALLAEADICIDPAPCNTLNHRSTMIKIGEYLAAGRPVVAFELDETRQTAGEAAWYARCADLGHFVELIDRLAGSPEKRSQLSLLGLARAPELTWERSADVLRRVYSELR
ncbi:MAG: glycosyltransferase family 4 protein [Gaiellaceae bacterium]